MKNKILKIYNENNLPVCDFEELRDLQGDFKIQTGKLFRKLVSVLVNRGLKYPFVVWIDEQGQKWTIDGHQRLKVLRHLKEKGYVIDKVPYYEIKAKDKKEAIEEIAFVNSQYAKVNPDTKLFEDFDINIKDLINVPNFEFDVELKDDDLNVYNNETCVYPLVPKYDEKYNAVVIICTTETEFAFMKTMLGVPEKDKSYKNSILGECKVVKASEVIKLNEKYTVGSSNTFKSE